MTDKLIGTPYEGIVERVAGISSITEDSSTLLIAATVKLQELIASGRTTTYDVEAMEEHYGAVLAEMTDRVTAVCEGTFDSSEEYGDDFAAAVNELVDLYTGPTFGYDPLEARLHVSGRLLEHLDPGYDEHVQIMIYKSTGGDVMEGSDG